MEKSTGPSHDAVQPRVTSQEHQTSSFKDVLRNVTSEKLELHRTPSRDIKDNEKNSDTDRLLDEDVEKQQEPRSASEPSHAMEYDVSTKMKMVALAIYFFLSLTITLQSKMLLGMVGSYSRTSGNRLVF